MSLQALDSYLHRASQQDRTLSHHDRSPPTKLHRLNCKSKHGACGHPFQLCSVAQQPHPQGRYQKGPKSRFCFCFILEDVETPSNINKFAQVLWLVPFLYCSTAYLHALPLSPLSSIISMLFRDLRFCCWSSSGLFIRERGEVLWTGHRLGLEKGLAHACSSLAA